MFTSRKRFSDEALLGDLKRQMLVFADVGASIQHLPDVECQSRLALVRAARATANAAMQGVEQQLESELQRRGASAAERQRIMAKYPEAGSYLALLGLQHLPEKALLRICGFLPASDQLSLRTVCLAICHKVHQCRANAMPRVVMACYDTMTDIVDRHKRQERLPQAPSPVRAICVAFALFEYEHQMHKPIPRELPARVLRKLFDIFPNCVTLCVEFAKYHDSFACYRDALPVLDSLEPFQVPANCVVHSENVGRFLNVRNCSALVWHEPEEEAIAAVDRLANKTQMPLLKTLAYLAGVSFIDAPYAIHEVIRACQPDHLVVSVVGDNVGMLINCIKTLSNLPCKSLTLLAKSSYTPCGDLLELLALLHQFASAATVYCSVNIRKREKVPFCSQLAWHSLAELRQALPSIRLLVNHAIWQPPRRRYNEDDGYDSFVAARAIDEMVRAGTAMYGFDGATLTPFLIDAPTRATMAAEAAELLHYAEYRHD